ncbi:hypothetical protein Tco_0340357 [Tanacetum coccineum]
MMVAVAPGKLVLFTRESAWMISERDMSLRGSVVLSEYLLRSDNVPICHVVESGKESSVTDPGPSPCGNGASRRGVRARRAAEPCLHHEALCTRHCGTTIKTVARARISRTGAHITDPRDPIRTALRARCNLGARDAER